MIIIERWAISRLRRRSLVRRDTRFTPAHPCLAHIPPSHHHHHRHLHDHDQDHHDHHHYHHRNHSHHHPLASSEKTSLKARARAHAQDERGGLHPNHWCFLSLAIRHRGKLHDMYIVFCYCYEVPNKKQKFVTNIQQSKQLNKLPYNLGKLEVSKF